MTVFCSGFLFLFLSFTFKPFVHIHSFNSRSKNLEIRTRIVQELLSTEEYYLSCLQKLANVYVPALRECGLSEKDFKSLFSNLETILKFNQELYKELKTVISSWSSTQLIGNIFVRMVLFSEH